MAQVTISSEFFINEIRNYSNWEQAFWRELFQNSIDAGASNIDIKIEKVGSFALVSFSDNGHGMDKNVLENVFFNLGTTTKNSSDTVGGFGRARIILCFAQSDYQIFTKDLYVSGCGSNYEIQDDWSQTNGCKFVITVPINKFYSNFEAFEQALYDYIALSKFNCRIQVNNILIDNYLYARGKKKDLSFGVAYANKSATIKNKIVFRVNGVAMFTRRTEAPILVVVEIDPKKSREVLLSNRDSLTWRCQDEVDEFCNMVNTETLSAFREKQKAEEIVIGSARTFRRSDDSPRMSQSCLNGEFTLVAQKPLAYIKENTAEIKTSAAKSPFTDGLVVLTKSSDRRIRAAAKNFSPDKIEASESRKLRLLKQWIIACEAALNSLCKIRAIEEISWRPGFVFDETMEACHKSSGDTHTLMLNPVHCKGDDLGKIKFSVNHFHSHVELLTLAAHEVAHCEYRYHDESYAGLFTDIVSDIMKNINILSKEMKAA